MTRHFIVDTLTLYDGHGHALEERPLIVCFEFDISVPEVNLVSATLENVTVYRGSFNQRMQLADRWFAQNEDTCIVKARADLHDRREACRRALNPQEVQL